MMSLSEYSNNVDKSKKVYFDDLPLKVRKKHIEDMEERIEKTKVILQKYENIGSN